MEILKGLIGFIKLNPAILKTKTFWVAVLYQLNDLCAAQAVYDAATANAIKVALGALFAASLRDAIQKNGPGAQ